MAKNIFVYGDEAIAYLKSRDKKLAQVIDTLGRIEREVIPDLFSALVHSIVGQQISSRAHETIWKRIRAALGEISPASIAAISAENLQKCGISFRKAQYVKKAAIQVLDGELNIEALKDLPDEEVCAQLLRIKGVGLWTAEMLMIFSMQRPNVLSFGDLAILRGMRMVYHHKEITREIFARHKRRLSPWASVASLYFWAVAGGAVPGMIDYAPKAKNKKAKGANQCQKQ